MPTEKAIIITEPKTLDVPEFSKKDIVDILNSEIKGFELVATGQFGMLGDDGIVNFYDADLDDPYKYYRVENYPDGLYLFTYGNCYAFVVITAQALAMSQMSPIKVSIPVIYSGDGSFRPGTLMVSQFLWEADGEVITEDFMCMKFKVIDGTGAVAKEYLTANIYRTKLM